MALRRILGLGLVLLGHGGCIHHLPRVVERARAALEPAGDLPDGLLSYPVTVVEVAYEVGPGWCAAHQRVTAVNDKAALTPLLPGLARAWAKSPPAMLAASPGFWGVVAMADCEHAWAVGLDPSSERVNFIVIDTPDSRGGNAWSPARTDYRRAGPWRN